MVCSPCVNNQKQLYDAHLVVLGSDSIMSHGTSGGLLIVVVEIIRDASGQALIVR